MLSKIVLSILLLSVVACGHYPEIENKPQCSPVFKYVTIEQKEFIDLESSYCICGMYEFSLEKVGPVGGSWKEPLKSCNKVIGWKPKDYAEVSTFWVEVWEKIRDTLEDYGAR
jgi:hypothetical protein